MTRFPVRLLLLALCSANFATLGAASLSLPNGTGAPDGVPIDDSWRLWLDEKAAWQNDKIFLPDEVQLAKLPVNPPTGGWGALSAQAGIPVTLPSTVEEHYWGQKPLPTAGAGPEKVVSLESPYKGVSWWYRMFTPPALKVGERLVLSFPGARLRAEVYVNGQLVGYNLITEIPFTADATPALKPGQPNLLAVRITNPGGTFSWGDFGLVKWGDYSFPISKGFGGLDGGVRMSVQAPVAVADLFVANHPEPRTVTLNAQVVSTGPAYRGPVALSISRGGKEVWSGSADVNIPAGGQAVVSQSATVDGAELWDINHPELYQASARLASLPHSGRVTDFGFRWFNAEGLGENARLVLNGHRIFISSAISWGYWAPNGMFPDHAAAQREVTAVRALGMNCVQDHRHFPKAAALDAFDQAGLLRYCEVGGGSAIWDETLKTPPAPGPIDPSGKGGEPVSFANKYELAKLLAMVKAYRSHPSVILWSLNNETGANSHNPKMFYAMRKVHELDPSRIVILKSGFGPEGEIMGRPYLAEMFYGENATGHDSGWHDNHNEGDAGVYQDSLYNGPTDFKCYTTDAKGIAMWGELGTANSPDDDAATVKWYDDHKVSGYNLDAARTRVSAYEAFLKKYRFDTAFPTAQALFQAAAARHYFVAAHIVENARIADANDYIALTGWESTTIDNNSGLVDALRQVKSDPSLLKQANAPELIVLHARRYVVAKGDPAAVDAFLVNELDLHGDFTLRFSAAMDADKAHPFFTTSFPVKVTGGETFSELLKENIAFVAPVAGPVTMTAELLRAGDPKPVTQRTEPLLVVDPNPAPLTGSIVAVDYDGKLAPALKREFGVAAVPLASAPARVDRILVSSANTPRFTWIAKQQEIKHAGNTTEPGLYEHQYVGQVGDVVRYRDLAPGRLEVELFFAEPSFDKPGQRVFDLALNGQTVLKNLDIFAEAGGKAKALVKKFTVNSPDGTLDLAIPAAAAGAPMIAALRVTDSKGRVLRQVFRKDNWRDAENHEWHTVRDGALVGFDWAKFLPSVLDRVKSGSRLVLLGMDAKDLGEAAAVLEQENLLTYTGTAGFDDTPWVGHWYFGKKHWLLDGLPSDCVLDWQYQPGVGGDGLVLDAPGMEPIIGYGKNPGPGLGLGAVTIPVGKGQIVLLAVSGLNAGFIDGDAMAFQPVTAKRIVYNALH
ncbi:MAG TPA: malectin domain-containing carbohydrate-binding protein [Chthoniobacterales bacterium]|nr:malectin domain-containing carbohydrate-binding protein [Chthoniobacterales bacterium]